MQRYFQISVHALIVSAFLALALTGRLNGMAIAIFATGLAISIYRTLRGLPALISPRAAFSLSCGYIAFFLFDSFTLSRSFIAATIHLVLFLELTKLFQEKTDKDYLYLIVLSFLKILAASSLTIDMSFVATLLLFLVALVSTLMSFDMYRSGRRATASTQNMTLPLGGMSVWATLWIIFTGIGLFFLIPRIGTGYFSRAATPALLLSGFTENVTLGEIGQVKLSTAVVMRARQLSGIPFAVLKWRGISLDSFDGRSWYKTDRKRFLVRRSPDQQYWTRPLGRSGDAFRYEILMEPLATSTLFGPHEIRAISGQFQGGMEMDGDDGEAIYTRFQSQRRIQYQVLSEVPSRMRFTDLEIPEEPIPSEIGAKYLQLPENLDPRVSELGSRITENATSTIEKASAVEAYLKRYYEYTLNLTWTPGPQPLSSFLFDAKVGHCEYFASSMAILLRTVGVPTRLVNGFLMGEYNPVGNDYIVRQSDAHSWVEVYVPGRGWLEFDPTPPDPNQKEMSLAVQLSHYVDAAELFWNSYILVYDSGAQLQLFHSAQERVQSAHATMRNKSDQWVVRTQEISDRLAAHLRHRVETREFWTVVTVIMAAGVAFRNRKSIQTRVQIWRLRRGSGVVDENVVETLFYRAARKAEKRSPKRRPAETWREWIFGLPDESGRSTLARALEVFEKSKYGSVPVSSAEFLILEEAIRKLDSR